ncbi:hypothetical protein NQ318_009337, partial [Aromia moschata]
IMVNNGLKSKEKVSIVINEKPKRRRLRVGDPDFRPPDGGWGWFIVFACGFSNVERHNLVFDYNSTIVEVLRKESPNSNPPYSLDLTPCDFRLVPKIKADSKETRYENLDQAKEETATTEQTLFETLLQTREKRMQQCVDRREELG